MEKIVIYDTTLRDGMQAEGISFSLEDKLQIAARLDELGVDYIEGGYAASNPKEIQFFKEASHLGLKNSRIVAFGSTHRADTRPSQDVSLNSIIACKTPCAALVGKSWGMHVQTVLGCSLVKNLQICEDSVKYLTKRGLEVIFDAEHFFDGFKDDPDYALRVLDSACRGGAEVLVLCDTNGGTLPQEIYDITKKVRDKFCDKFSSTIIGIHTHNDSDCAVANSISAVRAGAHHVRGLLTGLENAVEMPICVL